MNFTDEARWYSAQTKQFVNYDKTFVMTEPRLLHTVITKPQTPQASSWKIKKEDGAGPGSYNFTESYDNTQKRRVSMSKVSQERKSFTDAHIKMKKGVPGMGLYKNIDRGYKMTGRETL